MMSLNPTVSVTAMTETLNWDKAIEIVRGNDCVVDTSYNPCTRCLINNTCIMAERESKTTETTKGISGRGW